MVGLSWLDVYDRCVLSTPFVAGRTKSIMASPVSLRVVVGRFSGLGVLVYRHRAMCALGYQARILGMVEGVPFLDFLNTRCKKTGIIAGFGGSKHLVLGRMGEFRWVNTRFAVSSVTEGRCLKALGRSGLVLAKPSLSLCPFLVFLAACYLLLRSRVGQLQ